MCWREMRLVVAGWMDGAKQSVHERHMNSVAGNLWPRKLLTEYKLHFIKSFWPNIHSLTHTQSRRERERAGHLNNSCSMPLIINHIAGGKFFKRQTYTHREFFIWAQELNTNVPTDNHSYTHSLHAARVK